MAHVGVTHTWKQISDAASLFFSTLQFDGHVIGDVITIPSYFGWCLARMDEFPCSLKTTSIANNLLLKLPIFSNYGKRIWFLQTDVKLCAPMFIQMLWPFTTDYMYSFHTKPHNTQEGFCVFYITIRVIITTPINYYLYPARQRSIMVDFCQPV